MAGSVEPVGGGAFKERQTNKQFCVPEELAQSEMVQRFVTLANADMKKFPADAQMPAISFIGSVVTTSYPCR